MRKFCLLFIPFLGLSEAPVVGPIVQKILHPFFAPLGNILTVTSEHLRYIGHIMFVANQCVSSTVEPILWGYLEKCISLEVLRDRPLTLMVEIIKLYHFLPKAAVRPSLLHFTCLTFVFIGATCWRDDRQCAVHHEAHCPLRRTRV